MLTCCSMLVLPLVNHQGFGHHQTSFSLPTSILLWWSSFWDFKVIEIRLFLRFYRSCVWPCVATVADLVLNWHGSSGSSAFWSPFLFLESWKAKLDSDSPYSKIISIKKNYGNRPTAMVFRQRGRYNKVYQEDPGKDLFQRYQSAWNCQYSDHFLNSRTYQGKISM
jgi:hypothetical protein